MITVFVNNKNFVFRFETKQTEYPESERVEYPETT